MFTEMLNGARVFSPSPTSDFYGRWIIIERSIRPRDTRARAPTRLLSLPSAAAAGSDGTGADDSSSS